MNVNRAVFPQSRISFVHLCALRGSRRSMPEAQRPHSCGYNEPMIPKDLLDILVCPACRKPLALQEKQESLKCSACRRVYPIRDNIPILLIDEAVIDPA
jgi:hypothetical protein